ncbi:MAG: Hpt domain-containing protein [Phycisphaerae bacterium]
MSDYTTVTPELMAGFLDEAPEYLEMLDEGVMAFESKGGSGPIALDDPEDNERMNTMFRAAHSLKGLAAAMGFDKIRDLTHLMETLFDQIRMGKRAFDPASIETLFRVFDTLRSLVQELAETPEQPVSIKEALKMLEDILNTPAEATGANPASGSKQTATPKATPAGGNSGMAPQLKILDDQELLQLFVDTTAEAIEDLNQGLMKLEDNPHDLDTINEVFRCAHNIKGATGAAGCDVLCKITHRMETLLDRIRSDESLTLDGKLTNALLGVADRLRAEIDLIKQGRSDELSTDVGDDVFAEWLGASEPPAASSPAEDETAPLATEAAAESPEAVAAPSDTETPGGEPEADLGEDDDIVQVTVTFPEDFAEAEIQAYLIHNKLNEVGDVLKTDPDVDALDGSTSLETIIYDVQTTSEPAEIEKMLALFSAKSVKAMRGGEGAATQGPPDNTPAAAPAPTPAAPAVGSTTEADAKPPVAETAPATPAGRPTAAPAKRAPGRRPPAVPKVGETLRVDLERLDQLMNLGGELVISKARFVQIQGQFDPLFSGQNVGYLVDDMAERIATLNNKISELHPASGSHRLIEELADTTLALSHDFSTVKNIMGRVHDARTAMNDFGEALHGLNRISEGIQKRIMETRMVSVGPLFQRFRRVVRDISKSTGKEVELVLHGEATELDKRMIDELGDPLTHMVRNSVDHGVELPEERLAAGKPRASQVTLDAYHRGRHICIEVRDDGRGVDVEAVKKKIIEQELATPAQVELMTEKEIVQYVFKPGFSTAKVVTDLSGRGMGMDIVLNKLEKINGTVEIESKTGEGTVVTIKLPLTLAIITSLVARIGQGVYAIPLEMVGEIINVPRKIIQNIQRKAVIRVRERVIPVALFEQVFDASLPELQTATRNSDDITLLILHNQDEAMGLVVDEMIGQEDVVIKSLATNFRNVAGIAGASIMGDGSVSLILDVAAIMGMFVERSDQQTWSMADAFDAQPRNAAPCGRRDSNAAADPVTPPPVAPPLVGDVAPTELANACV